MTVESAIEELREVAELLVMKAQTGGATREEALYLIARASELITVNLRDRAHGTIPDQGAL